MTMEDILNKEVMPMGESRRDGLRRLILSEAKGVHGAILEGEVRSPGPGAKSGIARAAVSRCHCEERERRSNLRRGNAVMRQVKIGLLEKETKLKSGEVDSGCEIR